MAQFFRVFITTVRQLDRNLLKMRGIHLSGIQGSILTEGTSSAT